MRQNVDLPEEYYQVFEASRLNRKPPVTASHQSIRSRQSRGRKLAATALLALASVFVGLLFGELAVKLLAPQVFPVHPPGIYVADPSVGYVLTPGFRGELRRSEFRDTIRIGEFGFRGADPRPLSEPSLRVLVLGDSQAFGFGVADDETMSVQLERLLQARYVGTDVQVMNGGVPGYGTADQLAMLRSRGPILEPDVVVVQFLSINDLIENLTPAHTWARIKDGMLSAREGAVSTRMSFLRRAEMWIKRHSHLASLVSNSAGYWAVRLGLVGQQGAMWGEDFSEEQADLGTDLLVEIAATADSLGAHTLFLYTTGQASVIQEQYDVLPSRDVVVAASERAGVPWIDMTAGMRGRSDRASLFYPGDGHWTAEGHRVVAEIVADEIAP